MGLLFNRYDLGSTISNMEERMNDAIQAEHGEYILGVDIDKYTEHIIKEYNIEPLVIQEDGIQVETVEVDIDVRSERDRDVRGISGPVYVKGLMVRFAVPFCGDAKLLECQPSTFTWSPPSARVSGSHIYFEYQDVNPDSEQVKREFQSQLSRVTQYVSWVNEDVERHNKSLCGKARKLVVARREKLLANKRFESALGYPIRHRDGVPNTYTVPDIQRKVTPILQTTTDNSHKPEPELDKQNYEHILDVMSNMALVMERSPRAFMEMGEENLRWHFLVQLNGHYEGRATGETFNYGGKTDILIRHEGKNIFIAECKVWQGAKVLTETIDQILGYTSWRDTKTAIVVFNRNKDFTAVLAQIGDTVRKHPNYSRDVMQISETSSQYEFRHKDDAQRKLLLTVMSFNVPSVTSV